MTAKEAVSQLKSLMRDRESFFNSDGDDDVFRADAKACELAIEALEKQIPKKPDIYGDSYDKDGNLIYDTYDCPNCHTSYEIDYEKYDYCPSCGQALDWSEIEEVSENEQNQN